MKTVRVIAGVVCIVLGLSLSALLAMVGLGNGTGAPAAISLMPGVAVGLTVLAAGVWMVYTGLKKT